MRECYWWMIEWKFVHRFSNITSITRMLAMTGDIIPFLKVPQYNISVGLYIMRADERDPLHNLQSNNEKLFLVIKMVTCAKQNLMKKALRETQTLRAGCSKAEPKSFAPPQTHSRGRGTAKI